ncbi:MAG: three-Cys-motif partner protein TcmP [Oscillospiraceae bacterium]|nr:three-Cys-motif partner protein TcmP [Oscillospiraceae bacterium]
MTTKQRFGGPWTVEKLGILSDYIGFYATALKKQPFDILYIDAFAGTGKIEIGDEEEFEIIDGSAKLALQADGDFAEYIFIESKKAYADELRALIKEEFPEKQKRVRVFQRDCNDVLLEICDQVDWKKNRAILFLDPYAANVKWETLKAVAATGAIDVWYLFPFSAANRMLKKQGPIDPTWKAKLNSIFGDNSWETELYQEDPQTNLFGTTEKIKTADWNLLKTYIENQLRKLFPAVSPKSRVLMNRNNSPLFLFCFAVSNKSKTAQNLALRGANYILNTR